jgi:MFS family permease
LVVSATVVGTAFMIFQIAAQRATGELGTPGDRARNFSLLALGYSVSGFLGPLVVGFSIDRFGYRAPFAILAVVALVPVTALASGRLPLPGLQRSALGVHRGGVRSLLQHRGVRRALGINALISVGWDLYTAFVPVYGSRSGLSASQIGAVLAAFAAATFAVRLVMPAVARRLTEQQVLTAALFAAGAVYLAFPFSRDALTLGALSFCLGLGLGSGQPMVMSLLHVHTPAGRIGEAVGVRMSLVQSSQVVVPLFFGAVGASLGLAPVFWSVGACLTAGGYLARRGLAR